MQQAATVLLVVLGLIVAFLGFYVFSHRNRQVIIFHPEKDPSLAKIMQVLGLILLFCGCLSIISAFTNLLLFKIVMLILDAVFASSLSLVMLAYSMGN
ncbi:hypothetical protein SAMN05216431_104113 [Ligilactobacillus sp. WC1T17]|uniref:DUF3784 domain-containing protein n=1 Tax=Ligilactobacillus ruminis TaxID=1623 RepID=A0ABY1AAS7_9LACO|nr:hypothetical protein SAMN05216431_104113 [Ligilactobacillus ruminis]